MLLFQTIEDESDREFMETLYITYKEVLFCTAKGYLGDDWLAEDAVHDALVKLIDKIPLLRSLEGYRLRVYLNATVRNTAISMHGKLGRERSILEAVSSSERAEQFTAEARLIQNEEYCRLGEIIDELEDTERFLIEGRYLLSLSDLEMANNLGVKPSSIRMMLTRVRRKILERLQEDGYNG